MSELHSIAFAVSQQYDVTDDEAMLIASLELYEGLPREVAADVVIA